MPVRKREEVQTLLSERHTMTDAEIIAELTALGETWEEPTP
jgi:hypothetical protein